MSEKLKMLVTGVGPFPGAPYNPTMPLVARLTELRRPALDAVELTDHIFHVTYQTVDRELPELIARLHPQALLMFGLADRTPYLRVETRARNAVATQRPDADGNLAGKGSIVSGGPDAMTFGPHTARLLRAARATGIDARASRDAGSYLCNYLSWRAIEATQAPGGPALAAFIHIPLLARSGTAREAGITLEGLVDAGEAMLLEIVKLARQAARENVQA
ncbi:MAG: pyroglutamyl-peptidase I [Bradyrhizobium sp.]